MEVSAKVNARALRRGARRVIAKGSAKQAETETCANIVQGCPEGVTYAASASVAAVATVVFKRVR